MPKGHDFESHGIENSVPEVFKSRRLLINAGVLLMLFFAASPLLWICPTMSQKPFYHDRATWLALVGCFHVLWNTLFMRSVMLQLSPEPASELKPFSMKQKVVFFTVQFSLAFICMLIAFDPNPFGVIYWFWLPVSVYAVLLPARFCFGLLIVGAALAISTGHEYYRYGLGTAVILSLEYLTGSIYLLGCGFATKYALQQRWKLGRMTLQLQSLNDLLKRRAKDATALAISQERNRMAREIHDAVGHSLTVIGAQLEAAKALFPQFPEQAIEAVQKAQQASQEGLAETRRAVSALRSTPLDNRTLEEALESLIEAAQQPELKITFTLSGEVRALPSMVELTLYRCAQEGLTNACRHSQATEIQIELDFPSKTHVGLTVSDNGTGFSMESSEGVGLTGLRERASLLNGSLTVCASPSGGGLLHLFLPT